MGAMSEEPDNPIAVISGASETHAAMIASRLSAEGIKTQVVGTGISGWLPGLPNGFQVVVRSGDFKRARAS
jgi:hypothetical protein